MNSSEWHELKLNPEFQRLIQPLSKKTSDRLKDLLCIDASYRHVDSWNGFHMNNLETARLCISLNLPFQIVDYKFPNFEAAAAYICTYQLKRTDISDVFRKYLIGKKHYYEELISVSQAVNGKKTNKNQIASEIGKALNLSGGTVIKYRTFSDAVDIIYEHNAELAQELLFGKVKVSHANTIELSRLTAEELHGLAQSIKEDGPAHLTISDIRHEVKWRHIKTQAPMSRKERHEEKERVKAGIRQMPVYNPDSEINSLCMTVNSWISSMERVHNSVNYSTITIDAADRLLNQLTALKDSINSIQNRLLERISS